MESRSTVVGRLKGVERTIEEARSSPYVWSYYVLMVQKEWRMRKLFSQYAPDHETWWRWHHGVDVPSGPLLQVYQSALAGRRYFDDALRDALAGMGAEGKRALRTLDCPRKVTLPSGKWGADPAATTNPMGRRDWIFHY